MEWAYANPIVTEYFTVAVTTLKHQHHRTETNFRGRLPLSRQRNRTYLHRLGLVHAAIIVALVDPGSTPKKKQ